MRQRHLTLINGGPCDCESCRLQRLLFAIGLMLVSAAGLLWLLTGEAL